MIKGANMLLVVRLLGFFFMRFAHKKTAQKPAASSFTCVPGMGYNYRVQVPSRPSVQYERDSELLARGKGVHREVWSEGSHHCKILR